MTFHHSHHAFGETVVPLGIVVLVEVESEDERKTLPHIGSQLTDEGFGDLIARLVTFTVNQFNQQTSL